MNPGCQDQDHYLTLAMYISTENILQAVTDREIIYYYHDYHQLGSHVLVVVVMVKVKVLHICTANIWETQGHCILPFVSIYAALLCFPAKY